MKEDSELLLSVFVVQLGYASASQLMAAAAEWVTRRSDGLSLADVLSQRGYLDPEKRKMVEALMGKALQVNDGDVSRTLQSLATGLNGLMKSLSNSMVSDVVTREVLRMRRSMVTCPRSSGGWRGCETGSWGRVRTGGRGRRPG